MTLPADWMNGDDFTADDENAVEAAINSIASGATVIPRYVNISGDATLTLTTARNFYSFNGTTATWTLPAVSAGTFRIQLFNRGSGTLTVQRAGSDQIYRAGATVTSFALQPGQSADLTCDGTFWLMSTGTSVAPAFSSSSRSTQINNRDGGVATTWSHTVNAGATYAVMMLSGSILFPDSATPVATLGGTSLPQKGFYSQAGAGTIVFFAGPIALAAGAQTANLVVNGSRYSGYGVCLTYTNVFNSEDEMQVVSGGFEVSLTADVSEAPSILVALLHGTAGTYNPLTNISAREFISFDSAWPSWYAGDFAVASTEDFKVVARNVNSGQRIAALNLW